MQTTANAQSLATAVKCVFDSTDMTGSILSFYASAWGLRPLSLVSRGFKDLVRARVRSSLYMCNADGVWRLCVASGRVEKLATTPFRGTDMTWGSNPDASLCGQQATTMDSAVVVAGAMIDQRFAWRFDPIDSTWLELPSMLGGRGVHSLAKAGGRVFALGGKSSTMFDGCPMECLDVRSGAAAWQTIGPQHYAIADWCMHAGVGSGNYVYALGGCKDTGHEHRYEDSATVHRMNANTGAWEVVAPMNHPRSVLAVCGRSDGDFYALGGRFTYDLLDSDGEYEEAYEGGGPPTETEYLKSVERYLVSEDRWVTLAPMRAQGKLIGAAIVDGSLWAVIKGECGAIFLDKHDPSVDAWAEKHTIPGDVITFRTVGCHTTVNGFA